MLAPVKMIDVKMMDVFWLLNGTSMLRWKVLNLSLSVRFIYRKGVYKILFIFLNGDRDSWTEDEASDVI